MSLTRILWPSGFTSKNLKLRRQTSGPFRNRKLKFPYNDSLYDIGCDKQLTNQTTAMRKGPCIFVDVAGPDS